MDIDLLLGTLELDAQVALTRERMLFESSPRAAAGDTKETSAAHAFEQGFRQAAAVVIEGARRVLTEQLAGLSPEVLSVAATGPMGRRIAARPVTIEPEGWNLIDTTGSKLLPKLLDESRRKAKPAVVFDLDGTLVDVSYRTLGILKEWLSIHGHTALRPGLAQQLAHINLTHVGYSLANAFENSGLDLRDEQVASAFEAAEKYWRKRFFDGRALVDFDRALPGAAAFVNRLKESGLTIFYLTGRSAKSMQFGTKEQLRRLGLPLSDNGLFMKPNAAVEDHLFKQETFGKLAADFDIVANFENEYINITSMMDILPDPSFHVVVDTQHSGRPVQSNPRPVYRIQNFS